MKRLAAPSFFKFQSMLILVILCKDNRTEFQCLNIDHYGFGIQVMCEKGFSVLERK